MRTLAPAVVLGFGLAVAGRPAAAQVTVNPGALDLLPQRPAPRPRAAPSRPAAPPAKEAARPAAPDKPAPPAAPSAQGTPASPPAAVAKPTLPTVAPAVAALPPPSPVPPPRTQAAPAVPVAADAPGTASPFGDGLRVTFGPDRQELNPGTEEALQALARRLLATPQPITINAYAAGTAEDPSTARRLSLARALAARAVLINEGVSSTRIYPRALGAAGGDAGRDRVDVVPGPAGPPVSSPPVASAPAAEPAPAAKAPER